MSARLAGAPPGGMVRGAEVRFDEGDGVHTDSLGVVTRVWPNGRYATILSDGRTFVRQIDRVVRCIPTESDPLCKDYRVAGERQCSALGITFVVPVCRCGADRADHRGSAL